MTTSAIPMACDHCGARMVRTASCFTCPSCGAWTGVVPDPAAPRELTASDRVAAVATKLAEVAAVLHRSHHPSYASGLRRLVPLAVVEYRRLGREVLGDGPYLRVAVDARDLIVFFEAGYVDRQGALPLEPTVATRLHRAVREATPPSVQVRIGPPGAFTGRVVLARMDPTGWDPRRLPPWPDQPLW